MPSHSATLVEGTPSRSASWEVLARLACGCEVRLTVPADRLVQTVQGTQILVGKYPCPKGHPVVRP